MSHSVYEIDFTQSLNLLDSASFIYKVARSLAEKKRVCWVAGGVVRDLWLLKTPNDIDLVTDALDEEIVELFPNAVLVGQKFGVYKLPFQAENRNIIIDLTVFREEDQYEDGRRPLVIKRSTPEADAKRRDFTINALFYDLENHRVIDYVDGVNDLQNKILKCVGHADRRFNEDHLRLLRLVRFKAQFQFQVPEADEKAALDLSDLIQTVSGERIYEEILKVIKSNNEVYFWSQALTQKLWLSLGAKLNANQISKIDFIKKHDFSLQQRLVLSVLILWDYSTEALSYIKDRLKCSKEDVRFAQKVIEYKQELAQAKSSIEWALQVDSERDRHLALLILDLFYSFNDMQVKDLQEIKTYLNQNTEFLLSGADLLGRCEPSQIQKLLLFVRRAQFEKKIRTRDEALIFLSSQNMIIQKQ